MNLFLFATGFTIAVLVAVVLFVAAVYFFAFALCKASARGDQMSEAARKREAMTRASQDIEHGGGWGRR